MKYKAGQYCFPNLVEAFLMVVLFFVEYATNAIISQVGRSAGLQPMAIYSIGRVLAYGIVFTALLHHSKLTYRDLFHENPSSWHATLGLFALPIMLLTPGLFAGMNLLQSVVFRFLPGGDWDWRPGSGEDLFSGGLGLVVLICLIAPMVEEMLFRGIILRSFLRQYPPGTAIVHSSAVFGLAHLNAYQFLVAFCIGLVLGKLYERTRSLLPGILLHGCYNTAVVVIASRASPDASFLDWPASWWLGALASGSFGAWMLYRLIRIPAKVLREQ